MMINIECAEADVDVLDHERFNNPHPKVRRKMEALYLKAKGLQHCERFQGEKDTPAIKRKLDSILPKRVGG